ncbi:MAG TPA: hypothetical protein VFS00_30170 [Polyangiaceae bacterium]|nr:hypothetical protein [Polyangiaceae bacterium]
MAPSAPASVRAPKGAGQRPPPSGHAPVGPTTPGVERGSPVGPSTTSTVQRSSEAPGGTRKVPATWRTT